MENLRINTPVQSNTIVLDENISYNNICVYTNFYVTGGLINNKIFNILKKYDIEYYYIGVNIKGGNVLLSYYKRHILTKINITKSTFKDWLIIPSNDKKLITTLKLVI